jgi:hypothetical protein
LRGYIDYSRFVWGGLPNYDEKIADDKGRSRDSQSCQGNGSMLPRSATVGLLLQHYGFKCADIAGSTTEARDAAKARLPDRSQGDVAEAAHRATWSGGREFQ